MTKQGKFAALALALLLFVSCGLKANIMIDAEFYRSAPADSSAATDSTEVK